MKCWHAALREQGDCRRKGWRGSWNVRTILDSITHTHTRAHTQHDTVTPTRTRSHTHTTRGRAQLTHCQKVLKSGSPLAWQLQAGDNIWPRPRDSPHPQNSRHLPRPDSLLLAFLRPPCLLVLLSPHRRNLAVLTGSSLQCFPTV